MACKSFLLLLACAYLVRGAKLPSTFKICKRTDPNINECFRDAVQNALPQLKDGLPEFNFAPLEPVIIPSMTVDAGTGAVNLLQKFKDITIYNITNSVVDKADIKVSEDKAEATIYITVPQCSADCTYDFDGKVLMLPIKGVGKCHLNMENSKIKVTTTANRIQKKGVYYLKADDVHVDFMPTKCSFHFDNLFNGDEKLGEEMNKMINENWKDLFGEVKEGYETTLGTLFNNAANSVFSKVPLDELFPQ